jgi:hypothetical protein
MIAGAGLAVAQTQQHVPSRERVLLNNRFRTEIDGNNLRTSVFNFLFSGRTGANQGVPYEYPKNTGRYYVALVGLFLGGEVTDNTGATIQIVEWPSYHTNPATAEDWNVNPVGRPNPYWNPARQRIAKSDEPDTWPAFWPDKLGDVGDPGWRGKWNGYFGKNVFNADQELYYRIGDDNYTRWNYNPDTTDLTRKGLGIIGDARALEWSQASVADAAFFIHELRNDGTKEIKKFGVTLWLADFVGGDGDSQDDRPDFDLILDIGYSFDSDGISSNPAFSGAFVGGAGTLYMETPGNAVDRIDNDGDSPEFAEGPKVTGEMFVAKNIPGTGPELSGDQLDNNHNGLIDEDSTHVAFGQQRGVGYNDAIDNNNDGEPNSPVITQQMINQALADPWKRWPPNPERDTTYWPGNSRNFAQASIGLIDVGPEDLGKRFKDNIDNDDDTLFSNSLPVVTQAMVQQATSDPYKRYRVPNTNVILYDLGTEDIGNHYNVSADGQRNQGVDEKIDEMGDESRNNGVDDDGDWNRLTDDVGLDGVPDTRDPGEGDGKPTSGVGTAFPGEPNTDKVDVAEADQIGLTNVQYDPAGTLTNTTPDASIWAKYMLPGKFVDPGLIPTGESDLFVSSGVFPLLPGQIERISIAVVMGDAIRAGGPNTSGARASINSKRETALLAYNQDYQFAQAPLEPTVTAVPGDKKVTLYWDDVAESSVDRFLTGIVGQEVKDFQGYKIFRATDPAFEDARLIKDAYGNPAPWLKEIATFDLKDGIKGLHPTPFNGVQYDLGADIGVRHSFVDTTVQNGQKYYYCVRGYDRGAINLPLRVPPGQPSRSISLTPSESNLRLSIDPVSNKIRSIGRSIAIVTPEAPVAGYVPPSLTKISLVAGSTTGIVDYTIVDPTKILDNHKYRITFEDTVLAGQPNEPDTFKTKSFTLTDVTNESSPRVIINKSRSLADTVEQPITDGFRLALKNEKNFGVNPARSGWSKPESLYSYNFSQWANGFLRGVQRPDDYLIVFGPLGSDTSKALSISDPPFIPPAVPVNFKVFNTRSNRKIDFAFFEKDRTGGTGYFTSGIDIFNQLNSDIIIFFEKDLRDSLVATWNVQMGYDTLSFHRFPRAGDSLRIVLSKLFRASDIFEFTTTSQKVDAKKASAELDKIRVVPNPYIATATWEEKNPFSSGRGPRSLHFTRLPRRCTIRIYTVSGELVNTIYHDSDILDGTADWNMLTRDNLQIAYGVYVYHVDAGELGEKVGKFAVIK